MPRFSHIRVSAKALAKLLKAVSTLSITLLASSALANPKDMTLPPLPEPVSNNAVAQLEINGKPTLFSFMGLAADKSLHTIHNKAWMLTLDEAASELTWQPLPPVPSKAEIKGRLASVAVGLDGNVYLFGGYTVATDHSEQSSAENYRFDPVNQSYTQLTPTPVPVDDSVALTYRNRYIYLVSGWHNDGNVNLVQVFDTIKNEWFQASPFPGRPVFGHAGGIVDNELMICDGVAVAYHMTQRRSFEPVAACYLGVIDPINPAKIDWFTWVHPTDEGRYRMAASGDAEHNRIIFVGGSTNPYNYNGIGYDGKPSEPTDEIWVYELGSGRWQVLSAEMRTMDHRGLLEFKGHWLTIGGMTNGQRVTDRIYIHNVTGPHKNQ